MSSDEQVPPPANADANATSSCLFVMSLELPLGVVVKDLDLGWVPIAVADAATGLDAPPPTIVDSLLIIGSRVSFPRVGKGAGECTTLSDILAGVAPRLSLLGPSLLPKVNPPLRGCKTPV